MNLKFWKKQSNSPSLRAIDIFPEADKKERWTMKRVLHDPFSALAALLATILPANIAIAGGVIAGITLAKIIVGLGMLALSLATSMMQSKAMKRKAGSMINDMSAVETGALLQNTANIGEAVRVIYGTTRVGANRVFIHSKGTDNKALHIAQTWGEGPIEGIDTDADGPMIWCDEKRVSFYEVTGTATTIKAQWAPVGPFFNPVSTGDVVSTSGMEAGQNIMIELDNGDWHYSYINEVIDADTVKIGDHIPIGRTAEIGGQVFFNYADLVNYQHYYGSITGDDYCTDVQTQWNAAATQGEVDTTSRMKANEIIKIKLDNGTWHTSTIVSVDDGNTITIDDAIPGGRHADVDAAVHCLQVVCPQLVAAKSTWNDPMRGTAYSHFKLTYDQEAWAGLPLITAQIKGRRLYDPRLYAVPYTPDKAYFSNNLALVIYDFMTNSRYGMGIGYTLFDESSVNAAATLCDSEDWTFDGVIADRQDFASTLEDILLNGRIMVIWSEGQYHFVTLSYDAAVMVLTEDDIVEGSFSADVPGIPETPNRVELAFADENDNFTTRSLIVEEGNGELFPLTDLEARPVKLVLIGVTNYEKAVKLATYHLLRARFNKSFSFMGGARTVALEPGDCINVTHDFPDWTAEKIRVLGIKILSSTQVQLTCAEEDPTIYDNSALVAVHASFSSTLPGSDEEIPDITGLTATTGPDLTTPGESHDAYIKFSWPYVGAGYSYELEYRKAGDPAWTTKEIPAGITSYTQPMPDGDNTGLLYNPTYVLTADGGVFTDETVDATDNDVNDFVLTQAAPVNGDCIYIGYVTETFNRIKLVQGTAGAGVWKIEWQYYNSAKAAWKPLESVNDPTNGFIAAADTYYIDFKRPKNWKKNVIDSKKAFWVRGRVKNYVSITTQPLGTRIYVGQRKDPMIDGVYTGTQDLTYVVQIDGEGDEAATVDSIKWSDDGGVTWDDTLVAIGDIQANPTAVFSYDKSGGTYTDDLADATDADVGDVELLPAVPAVGDMFYVGYSDLFNQIKFVISQVGTCSTVLSWQYWHGVFGWKEINAYDLEDAVDGFEPTAAGTYKIRFKNLPTWEMTTVNGYTAYFIRCVVTATGAGNQPLGTQIWIIQGVDWVTLNNGLKVKFEEPCNALTDDKWTFKVDVPDPVVYRVGQLPCSTIVYWKARVMDGDKRVSAWVMGDEPIETWAPVPPSMYGCSAAVAADKHAYAATLSWLHWHGAKSIWFRWLYYTEDCVDFTDIWDDASKDDSGHFDTTLDTDHYIYVGHTAQFNKVKFFKGDGGAQTTAASLIVEYYDGSAWKAVTNLKDMTKTSGKKPLQQDGAISWNIPEDWATTYIFGEDEDEGYYVRISSSAALSANSEGDWLRATIDSQVKNYKIYRSTGTTCDITQANYIATVDGKVTNYNDKGLTPGVEYTWRVMPIGWGGLNDEIESAFAGYASD